MLYLLHLLVLVTLAVFINSHVPEPYMDEIFHIPQAQQYCQGDYYTWDPKLTTPPGLYWISNLFNYITRYDVCTVNALRFTNILFAFGLYFVLDSLTRTLHKANSRIYTLSLVWFPIGFFYNFVYYTDSGSTFFVLLSYLLSKKRYYLSSGIISLISLTFRQTNVIWTCLFMMTSIIDILSTLHKRTDTEIVLDNPKASNTDNPIKPIISLIVNIFNNLGVILPKISTYILTIGLFAAFLVWNKGIVLGDKSNHVAGLHFPQLFYFTSFLSFFAGPWIININSVTDIMLNWSIKRMFIALLSGITMTYLIHHHTYEHPFLLSDNRHYTFYVWKRIFKRHWIIRYLLTPFYLASSVLNIQAIAKYTSFLELIGYMFALILTLVPSPLLEFRYFIIPFYFYMIHIPPPQNRSRTLLALVMYTMMNAITIYLYIYKPFTWPSEPGKWQRFMW
ncbi:glycosyltransferase family 59 protein [Backusella circina FSU 941]|nr:glycosyltransferase family 59 protein [Backusella circina FSU 941]